MTKKSVRKEKTAFSTSGWPVILLSIASIVGGIFITLNNIDGLFSTVDIVLISLLFIFVLFTPSGFYSNEPNQSSIMMLFGSYVGTDKNTGIRWTIPFYKSVKISQRVEEYESEIIKVNDLNGNPIEVSSIVIWKVKDTYNAYFEVADYANFLMTQVEAALRELAMNYTYDSEDSSSVTLTGNLHEISEQLKIYLQKKLVTSGIEILDARINHLSYSKEIAQSMLQKQQAGAVISARKLIVEGAVSMVETAIDELEKRNVVNFDVEARRKLVSNLLVVLCSEQSTQPMMSTDS